LNKQPIDMIPIGSSNDFRDSSKLLQINELSTSTQSTNPKKHNDKSRKHPNKLKPNHHSHHQMKKIKPNENDELSASILSKFIALHINAESRKHLLNVYLILDTIELNYLNKNARKHQRNHKNITKSQNSIIDKLIQTTQTTILSSTSDSSNSPYMILINDESLSNDYNGNSEPDATKEANVNKSNDKELNNQNSSTENYNSSNTNVKTSYFLFYLALILVNLLNYKILF